MNNHSVTQRVRRRLQQWMQHTLTATRGGPPDPADYAHIQLSHASTQEFGSDMTVSVLHLLAKSLNMEPRVLYESPALRQLLQPYVQWLQHTPQWMQIMGLVCAKKLHGMVVHNGEHDPDTEARAHAPNLSILPGEIDSNQDRWMSSSEPTTVATAPEYIDVDQLPDQEEETPPKEEECPIDIDPQASAYVVEPPPTPRGDSAVSTATDGRRKASGGKRKKEALAEPRDEDHTVDVATRSNDGAVPRKLKKEPKPKKESTTSPKETTKKKNTKKPEDHASESEAPRKRSKKRDDTPRIPALPPAPSPVLLVEDTTPVLPL